jgi:hypothetical protein
MAHWKTWGLAILVLTHVACGSDSSGFGSTVPPKPAATVGIGEQDAGSSDGGGLGMMEPTPPPDSVTAEVYGHSGDQLFRLDPISKAVFFVGTFKGCGSEVYDLAMNKDSQIYVTTATTGLYSVDKKNATCTLIKSGNYPNSLSFIPAGILDINDEALVGYEGSDYVKINYKTGVQAIVRKNALGDGLTSSGDIVSVKGGPTYLTVTGGDGPCVSSDCLVRVDPKTGAVLKNYGSVDHTDVYGLAFWAGEVYGFDASGKIFQVTVTGTTLTTKNIPIPNMPAGLSFNGAGSSTLAPIGPN